MRYQSKADLLQAIRREHDRLVEELDGLPAGQRTMPGAWGDGWTLVDLIAHLTEWHGMFLRWYHEGAKGSKPEMPAPGFKWNETPRLNREIWAKHAGRPWKAVRRDFDRTYEEIVALVEGLSEGELLEPGHFSWTGSNPLTTYLGPNTASHYRFGSKVVKRWKRQHRES